MMNHVQSIDGSVFKSVYVVGDLHGSYQLLMSQLTTIDFDFENDLLDFLHKSFFNQFNCLSFTQSKLYMPASKLNRKRPLNPMPIF